jgi:1,4-dihydroxy-6-naphthoate synthase
LVELLTGGLARPVIMPFDLIMPALVKGEVDAGVIIHEARFTFGSYGLRRLIDLGEWWEDSTGLPVPLGGIAVRRALRTGLKAQVDRAVRASVESARAHPEASGAYVRQHSQEMDPLVCQQHIDLYVNDFTVDYGPEGEEAVRRLLGAAAGLQANASPAETAASRGGVFWDD